MKYLNTPYRISDIITHLEIPRRLLLYYVEKEVVVPAIPSESQGSAHGYSYRNIKEFYAVYHLHRAGISPMKVRNFIDDLRLDGSDESFHPTDEVTFYLKVPGWV